MGSLQGNFCHCTHYKEQDTHITVIDVDASEYLQILHPRKNVWFPFSSNIDIILWHSRRHKYLQMVIWYKFFDSMAFHNDFVTDGKAPLSISAFY